MSAHSRGSRPHLGARLLSQTVFFACPSPTSFPRRLTESRRLVQRESKEEEEEEEEDKAGACAGGMHAITLANISLQGGVGKFIPSSQQQQQQQLLQGDDGSATPNTVPQSKRGSSVGENINLAELRLMGSTQSSTSHSLEMGTGPVAQQKPVQGATLLSSPSPSHPPTPQQRTGTLPPLQPPNPSQ